LTVSWSGAQGVVGSVFVDRSLQLLELLLQRLNDAEWADGTVSISKKDNEHHCRGFLLIPPSEGLHALVIFTLGLLLRTGTAGWQNFITTTLSGATLLTSHSSTPSHGARFRSSFLSAFHIGQRSLERSVRPLVVHWRGFSRLEVRAQLEAKISEQEQSCTNKGE